MLCSRRDRVEGATGRTRAGTISMVGLTAETGVKGKRSAGTSPGKTPGEKIEGMTDTGRCE